MDWCQGRESKRNGRTVAGCLHQVVISGAASLLCLLAVTKGRDDLLDSLDLIEAQHVFTISFNYFWLCFVLYTLGVLSARTDLSLLCKIDLME